MFCPKCGAEIPDGSVHCSSCGAKITGEAPGAGAGSATMSMISAMIKADPAGALTILGCFLMILGAFLPWATGSSVLGVAMAQGAVLLLIAVLFLALMVLARSGAAGAWGLVTILLSLLSLALIFQSMKYIGDIPYASIGAGVWLTMVGVFVITAAAFLQQFGTAKK